MKNIMIVMEQNCSSDVKKLMFIYGLCLIVSIGTLCFSSVFFLETNDIVGYTPYIVSFIAITVVHLRRIAGIWRNGAIHRILLLPIKRYTVVASEWFFVFASYACYAVVPIISWLVYYGMNENQLITYANSFMLHSLSSQMGNLLMPINFISLLYLVAALWMLSGAVIVLGFSFSMKNERTTALCFCIFMILVCYSIPSTFLWVKVMLILLAIVIEIVLFKKILGVRRKGK